MTRPLAKLVPIAYLSLLGRGGSSVIPTLADCTTNGTTGCVSTSTYKSADLTNLAAGNVKRGVSIAGTTGNFPSAASPLPRYSDNGSSTTTQSDGVTTDFTNFISQLTTAGSFEFWDSTGIRRTGSGDADIVAGKIKDTVGFENLSITGTYTGAAPSAWDLRAGTTVSGVTGKLKVNCRNSIRSANYNYDGPVAGIPTTGVTTGTTFDIWDTIDDIQGQPPSSGFPAAWSVSNNYCGGVESVVDDDNVWKDVTTAGCNATNCRFKDKISGLEWTKPVQFGLGWPQAINTCAGLTHDGLSGWRLPTQKELQDASGHGIAGAASANWIPPGDLINYFWTSTTTTNDVTFAWTMKLSMQLAVAANKGTTGSLEVVCVR